MQDVAFMEASRLSEEVESWGMLSPAVGVGSGWMLLATKDPPESFELTLFFFLESPP